MKSTHGLPGVQEVVKRTMCILSAGFLALISSASVAEEPPAGVEEELRRFNEARPVKLAHDDPRFGVIRVLSLLTLDHPGLEKVQAAAEAKRYDEAEQELLAYFKKTRSAREPVKSLGAQARLHADDALRHYFRGNKDVHPPVFRGARIDWTGRAFVDGKEIHDGEWYLQFQRLTWWPALAQAYSVTADERYFQEWRFELVTWAEELLPFTRKTPKFVARGMETDSRCGAHVNVLPHMIRSPGFDSKTLLYFLASFHDQADHITRVYAGKGNHRLTELRRSFCNGVDFPEFKRSDGWIQDALTLLPPMIDDDVYDDGMNKELVFSYHTMYIGLFLDAYQLFQKHGYENRLPPGFRAKILKMAEIYAMQSFPDFTICQFGDAWKPGDTGWVFRRQLAPLAADIPYFDFMASNGKAGAPPSRRSASYPESGFYFFRSDWSRDAVFMPLKCGAKAEWHNQPDNGTFELYAYGRNLMTDSGCYLYGSTDPEEQRWRAWFRGTRAHKTLTLDNRDSDFGPACLLWSESTNLVALVVENQSYPGLKHRRTVLFCDNQHFLIHDEAIGPEAGTVRIHFQFAPGPAEFQGLIARTRYETGANLLVKTFAQEKQPALEQEEGWISYAIAKKETRPAWSWSAAKAAGEEHVSFLTALIPTREGSAPDNVEASVKNEGDVRRFTLTVGPARRMILLDVSRKTARLE
jgi:heparan-sulfate lyase